VIREKGMLEMLEVGESREQSIIFDFINL